jgi:DNA-binding response OmpR family regulator
MTKVLIIDDDEEYCRELSQVIQTAGFEVNSAFDGISGKDLIQEGRYGLVLLDLKLPGLSGYQLLREIRKDHHPVKVLVLSGRPLGETLLEPDKISKNEEEEILRMADAVMSKPFKVNELLDKVKELTR